MATSTPVWRLTPSGELEGNSKEEGDTEVNITERAFTDFTTKSVLTSYTEFHNDSIIKMAKIFSSNNSY